MKLTENQALGLGALVFSIALYLLLLLEGHI